MKYHFDTPPTREGIIQEFGINPERLHQIETFIQSVAVTGNEFDPSKDKFTMAESAYILQRGELVEAFALLCSLPVPCEWTGSPRLVILNRCWGLGAVAVHARFDKFGKLLRWYESDHYRLPDSQPWMLEKRELCAIAADEDWLEARREEARRFARDMEEMLLLPGVAAVACCPLSPTQWRRKFLSERWNHSGLSIAARLIDEEDLTEWNSFLNAPTARKEELDEFQNKWGLESEAAD